jgi:23S rRNA (uridine2552-2'-O)-methyltransferase
VTKERWLAERRSDPWHRKAKEEGYPSRAAYKLIFIQQKYRVIKRGDLVVNLGSWPGGMLSLIRSVGGYLVDHREGRPSLGHPLLPEAQ